MSSDSPYGPCSSYSRSIAVDFWRSRALRRVAEQTGSPALATDAYHFASDIWASVAVLAGLLATWAGVYWHIDWLRYADPVAAIFVSLMILRITATLTRETVGVLMDQIPAETRLQGHPRSRDRSPEFSQSSRRACVVPVLTTSPTSPSQCPAANTFEHTGELVRAATEAVHHVLPQADVVIHTVPRQERADSIFDRVRAVAARNNVAVARSQRPVASRQTPRRASRRTRREPASYSSSQLRQRP